MRVLLLTQWFDPEPTPKGLNFARELIKRGHEVEVVTGFPNYPGGKLYPGYRLKLWQRELVDGVPVVRVLLYPSHDRSKIRRVLNYASFALSAATLGWALSRKPDLIFAYHPPATIGLAAAVMKVLSRVPLLYDINDLWPDALRATGGVSNPRLLKLVGAYCLRIYNIADQITVISPGFRRALIERGVPAEKVNVVYNWCDEDSIYPCARDPKLARRLGIDASRFNVMFAGNLGQAQGLSAVLASAKMCYERDPNIEFIFVGGGTDRDRLERAAEDMRLSNVRFVPPQPMTAMAPILALADATLVHLRDEPLMRITIPSKMQAYLAAGRPVVMGVKGDAAELVQRSGAGVLCEPENALSITEAILAVSRMDPAHRKAMGDAGREFYHDNLSVRVGLDRFEDVFAAALNVRKQGRPRDAIRRSA